MKPRSISEQFPGLVCLTGALLAALSCGGSSGSSSSAGGPGGAAGNGTGNIGGSSGGPGPGVPTGPGTWNGGSGVGQVPRLPGGGQQTNTPLAPGCTAASANECPTLNGACATGAGQTVTVKQVGTLCLYEERVFTAPAATIEYLEETVAGQTYYRFRVTFNTGFVDNSYGKNSIGWPPNRGHRWSDLVKSDHTELQLFDKADQLALHFKMDYISPDSSKSCGYGTLGVKGGDGTMLVGDRAHVLAVSTSLDRALNACGYCTSAACEGSCTVSSPATDKNYTPNPLTPNWDYRLQYDVWIASEAFGASGFGRANISYVHASPAKTPQDTLTVTSKPCPPPFGTPLPPPPPGTGGSSGGYPDAGAGGSGGSGGGSDGPPGGTCPVNTVAYLTSEGAIACAPVPTTPPGGGSKTCPAGWSVYLTSEGAVCLPTPKPPTGPGGTPTGTPTCPVDYTVYITSEGAICVPKPGKNPGSGAPVCPAGWSVFLASEGAVCLPTPKPPTGPGAGPTCPVDYSVYLTSEGAICVPKVGKNPVTGAPVCPAGWSVYLATEGAACVPAPKRDPDGTSCPVPWTLYVSSEGAACVPQPGKNPSSGAPVCPANWKTYLTSEGAAVCTPIPTGTGGGNPVCPANWTLYLQSEGASCVPAPKNGVCPAGYKPDVTTEGQRCI